MTKSEVIRLLHEDYDGNAPEVSRFLEEVANEFTADEAFSAVITLVDTPDGFK